MDGRYDRLALLLGDEALERLRGASVLVTGLGGVGSPCAEALVRSGVGRLGVLDAETVERSNINRQLVALESTVGRPKTEVFAERARDIDPDVEIIGYPFRLNRETRDQVAVGDWDVVVDCIDALIPKLNLITACLSSGVPVVSSTGAGFKVDPTLVRVGSIWTTRHDPLAHKMRKKLRQWDFGEHDFPVVYSPELRPPEHKAACAIGSMVTVTGVFGLLLASETLGALLGRPLRGEAGLGEEARP